MKKLKTYKQLINEDFEMKNFSKCYDSKQYDRVHVQISLSNYLKEKVPSPY